MSSDPIARSSVLLVADGLRPSALGPYGNTWFDTLNFNRLAGQSLLFEKCICDTPELSAGFQGLLTGRHCCTPTSPYSTPFEPISKGGAETVLLSVAGRNEDCRTWFDRVVEVDLSPRTVAAGDLSETELANYFATAIEVIRETHQATFLVLDCPGFSGAWDAPVEYRARLTDEEDPDPAEFVDPPRLQFNDSTDDPDLLFGYQVAYGAQVVVLDRLLGFLMDELDGNDWLQDALFCLTSTRAFPLGEHGVVGYYRPILHSEMTHVPAFVRFPGSQSLMYRSQQLVQPGSLFKLIADWMSNESEEINSTFPAIDLNLSLPRKKKEAIVSKCSLEGIQALALQTHAWKFISGPSTKLFVCPDDIWEFNDTMSLCPQVGETMNQTLSQAVAELENGRRPDWELPDELAFGVE